MLGAKGTGKARCVGVLPSVMIAILNTLTPLGVRELEVPATPRRAIQGAAGGIQGGAVKVDVFIFPSTFDRLTPSPPCLNDGIIANVSRH